MSRDEVAEKLFDASYSRLSAWGKKHVDEVMIKMGFVEAPYTTTLHDGQEPAKLREDNERLARDLESARMENLELWDENSELKSQLAELQTKFNPPSTS